MAANTGEPLVEVRQVFIEETPNLIRPILAPVIIGTNFQIETRLAAGLYTGSSLVLTYPDIKAGAVVQTAETEVGITTVEDRFDITTGFGVVVSATSVTIPASLSPEKELLANTQLNTTSGTTLEDISRDFFTLGIRQGDIVQFITDFSDLEIGGSRQSNQPGDYIVTAITSPTELDAAGNVPANNVGTVAEPYAIVAVTNDVVELTINGVAIPAITLTAGAAQTAQDIVDDLNADLAFTAEAIADTFTNTAGNVFVRITSRDLGFASSILFETPALSAHTTLGIGKAAEVTGTVNDPFAVVVTVNDTLDFTINGVVIPTITLTAGAARTAAQVVVDINASGAFFAEAIASDDNGFVKILSRDASNSSIIIGAGTANATLGFSAGTTFGDTFGANNQPLITETSIEYRIERRGSSAGTVDITYRARRTDTKEQLFEFQDLNSLEAELGLAVPENPISFGMSLALQNSNLSVLGVAVGDDTVSEYQTALEFLEDIDVWGIVPLTQSPTVFQLLQAHEEQMSSPGEGRERTGLINPVIDLFTEKQVLRVLIGVDPTGGGPYPTSTFDEAGALFLTNLIVPGDEIHITSIGGADSIFIDGIDQGTPSVDSPILLLVASIIDETEITIVGQFTAGTSITDISYLVRTPDFTKFQLANNIKALAQAFQDRRLFMIHPDVVRIAHPTTGINTQVPGYYLGAALAGQMGSLKPSQGHSTLPVAGFTGLLRSNGFFSKSQLDIISSGGVWIFTQRVSGAPLTTRHQLSTDITSLERSEASVTKVTDYGAKFFRLQLTPLLGRTNVSKEFIERQLRPSVEAVLRDLKEDMIIGMDSRVLKLAQNHNSPDTIDVEVEWRVFAPTNKIVVTLNIGFQLVGG